MSGDAPLVVVDASVVVKWFVSEDESGVAEAAALLADHAAGHLRLVAPALLAHELMGVLVRRLRGPVTLDTYLAGLIPTAIVNNDNISDYLLAFEGLT